MVFYIVGGVIIKNVAQAFFHYKNVLEIVNFVVQSLVSSKIMYSPVVDSSMASFVVLR